VLFFGGEKEKGDQFCILCFEINYQNSPIPRVHLLEKIGEDFLARIYKRILPNKKKTT